MDILRKTYSTQHITHLLPFLLLASALIFVHFANGSNREGAVLGASTYHWTQTDWVGGVSSGVITGTVNTYTALSNLDVSTPGELKMKIKTDWALPTWSFRTPITINNGSGGELTDFQYVIDVNTTSLIAAGKLQSDCDDIRVTNSGGGALPYWIQTSSNQCNTGHTYIWTKSTLSTGNNTIYIYYGNSGASTAENGSDVFDFFDDFNDGSIGASWTTNAGLGSVSEANGKLNLHCEASVACDWWTGALHNGPYTVASKPYTDNLIVDTYIEFNNPLYSHGGVTTYTDINNAAQFGPYQNATIHALRFSYINADTGTYPTVSTADDTTNNGKLSMVFRSSTVYYYFNDTWRFTANNFATAANAGLFIKTWSTSSITDLYSDWFLMRKYTATVPTATIGSEEFSYYATGYVESRIFDTAMQSSFGDVTMTSTGSGIATIKVRSGDSADLSDASAFNTCNPMSSGYDMTLNNCVDDNKRYIQYRVELAVNNNQIVSVQDLSIGYDLYDPALDSTYGSASVTNNADFNAGSGTSTIVSGDTLGLTTTTDFSGNKYRLPIVFHNAETNARTDFQQKFVLDTATLIGAGKMKDDCGDIRITTTAGAAVSYFVESGCNTASTNIWVKIPTLAASADTTLYLYYGSADLTTLSSATDVFMYYNTFATDPVMSHSQWYVATNNWYDVSYIDMTDFALQGSSLEYDIKWTSRTYNAYGPGAGSPGFRDDITTGTTNQSWRYYGPYMEVDSDEVEGNIYWGIDNELAVNTGFTHVLNTWYRINIEYADTGRLTITDMSTGQVVHQSSGYSYLTSYVVSFLQFASVYTQASTYWTPISWDDATDSLYFALVRNASNGRQYGYIDNMRVKQVSLAAVTYDYSTEQTLRVTSGSWESASIDMIVNAGWGMTEATSDAVIVDLSDLNSNTTIKLSARAAASLVALAAAPYVEIDTWNSSGQHIIDKQTLDATDLTKNVRYLQMKLEFTNTNYTYNPVVNSVTFRYLKDALSPDANASALHMYRSNGGTEIDSTDWLILPTPYFSWTAGHDNESSIGGYCVYLGSSAAADPIQDKGLLGASPKTISGAPCPFIIEATNLDGGNMSMRGGTWLTSSASAYYINIKAIDNAGNPYEGSSLSGTFYFDNTSPTLPTYFSLPGGYVADKGITFTWPIDITDGADDEESGFAGLQYRIGSDGTWYGDTHNGDQNLTDLLTNDGIYTMDETVDYPALIEGVNFVYIRALDVAGNPTTDVLTGTVLLNTVAPSPPLNLAATPTDNTVNEYSFDWDVPATFSGNAANLTYCYVVNALPSVENCNFTEAGVSALSTDAYATLPGTNTMYVSARDEAGNINYALYDEATFIYSGTAPGLPLGVDVSDVSVKTVSSWKLAVTWEAPTDLGTGVSYYQLFRANGQLSCNTNFSSFSQISSTLGTSYVDTGLTQQNYSYCVKACDSANNCSAASTTKSGYPDGRYTVPPAVLSSPVVSNISTRSATISWVTNRQADTRVAYGFSSGTYFPLEKSLSAMSINHQITLRDLSPGTTYFFTAKWIDEDGNIGSSSEYLFMTAPPPIVQDVSPVLVDLDTAEIQFTVAGAVKVKVYYGADLSFVSSKELATSTAKSTYTMLLTGLTDGTTYNYRVVPIDSELVEYTGTAQQFTTPARPVISDVKIEEVPGESSPTLRLTWLSNVETSSIIEYYPQGRPELLLDSVDPERKSGTHEYTIDGLFASTVYVFKVRGRDYLGNEADSGDITVVTAEDLRPPLLDDIQTSTSIISAKVVNVGGRARLTIAWTTDEPATSQIDYGIGTGGVYSLSTQLDSRLTFDHTVVISDLDPSSVYHFKILSGDEAGNIAVSNNIVALTPKADSSALNIVLNNLMDIFSFLDR